MVNDCSCNSGYLADEVKRTQIKTALEGADFIDKVIANPVAVAVGAGLGMVGLFAGLKLSKKIR